MNTQEINKEFKTFKSVQVEVIRKSMDTLYTSIRTWCIEPDCLNINELRKDVILFQWNDCKPETYFIIRKWQKRWSKNAVIKTIFNEYNKNESTD
jgi:hypothetical protein